MSLISKTQLIKDIADAYRTASGTSDLVRYDELTQKISELSTESAIIKNVTMDSVTELTITDQDEVEHDVEITYGSDGKVTKFTYDDDEITVLYDSNGVMTKVGSTVIEDIDEYPEHLLSKTVTFMNGENAHQIISTNTVAIAEPTTPSGSGVFEGWYDGSNKITFPYLPSADKTLTANFQQIRTEMEITDATTPLWTYNNNTYTKLNNGKAIAGACTYNAYDYGMQRGVALIAETPEACAVTGGGSLEYGSLVYSGNGKTYYYCGMAYLNIGIISSAFWTKENTSRYLSDWVPYILDHYFYADEI